MGKLKWATKSISFSCQDPPKFTKSVSKSVRFSCYPFSLTRFGATEKECFFRDAAQGDWNPRMGYYYYYVYYFYYYYYYYYSCYVYYYYYYYYCYYY